MPHWQESAQIALLCTIRFSAGIHLTSVCPGCLGLPLSRVEQALLNSSLRRRWQVWEVPQLFLWSGWEGSWEMLTLRGECLFTWAAEVRLNLTLVHWRCCTCPNVQLCKWGHNLWLLSSSWYADSCSSCFTLHCSGFEGAQEAQEGWLWPLCALLKLLPVSPGAEGWVLFTSSQVYHFCCKG